MQTKKINNGKDFELTAETPEDIEFLKFFTEIEECIRKLAQEKLKYKIINQIDE